MGVEGSWYLISYNQDPTTPTIPSQAAKIPYAWEGIYGARKQERFRPLLAHGPRSTRELSRSGPTHKRLVRECIMPAHHLPVRCGDTPITHILEGP